MSLNNNGWQPIASAPKDGTHILLLVEGFVIEGWWYENSEKLIELGWVSYWEVAKLPVHGCDCCSVDNKEPDGWMPLPIKEVVNAA